MAAKNAATTANFPYPVLTKLGTTNMDPTFESLQVMQVQLKANAASIHYDRGNGINGRLALTITLADYALRSIDHVAFTPSMNHPDVPAHLVNATATKIVEDKRAHAHQQHEFDHCHNVDKTLHSQLITAMPAIYIAALRDPIILFGYTKTLELLAHLPDMYGGII
jgi:hypothetical protein